MESPKPPRLTSPRKEGAVNGAVLRERSCDGDGDGDADDVSFLENSGSEESTGTSESEDENPSGKKEYKFPSRNMRRIMLSDSQRSDAFIRPKPRSLRKLGTMEWRPQGISNRPEIYPGRLCEFCNNLNLHDLLAGAKSDVRKVGRNQGHHHTPQRLEESAVRCPLCRLFYRELASKWVTLVRACSPEPVAPQWGQSRFKIWAWNGDLDDTRNMNKRLRYLVLEWCGRVEAVAEVMLTAKHGSAAARLGGICDDISNPYIDGISSSKSWSTIRSLLTECHLLHGCHLRPQDRALGLAADDPLSTPVPLPTRVIVVDPDRPRLLETNGACGVYAALSHCWGDVSTVKTTRLNIERHKERIDLSRVFRTFQHAIFVCHVLGIPYLWIDSLCIIQHDASDPQSTLDDFTKESQLMGQIYSRAVLTIAATGASDVPTMGLLGGERHSLRQLVEIPFRVSRQEQALKPGQDNEYMYASPKPKGFVDEVSDSRLFTRGWVFQERLLSARYLHFGREQWFWQCRQRTHAESDAYEDDVFEALDADSGRGADLGMIQALRESKEAFSEWWSEAVEIYSQLDFTRMSDRKIAIDGLMNEIQRISTRQHSWGIWIESMHLQMMWYSSPDPDRAQSSAPQHARRHIPSWSWLESDEPIHFVTPARHSMFRQSGSAIAYPGGTAAVSAVQFRLVRPSAARSQSGTPTPGLSLTPPRPGPSEVLLVHGCVRTGYIEPHAGFEQSIIKAQRAADLRLGPLAMLARLGTSSTPTFPYRLLQKTPYSHPDAGEEVTHVGYCTAEEHHVGSKVPPNTLGSVSGQPTAISVAAPAPKWPMEVVCLLLSNNVVLERGRSWRITKGKDSADEPAGEVISHNVLLLQKIKSNAARPVYRRIGMGVILKGHVGWFEMATPSIICLV